MRPIVTVMTVSVYLSVREHISVTTCPSFFVHFLWRRCDVVCTSGFMNDAMFVHNSQE